MIGQEVVSIPLDRREGSTGEGVARRCMSVDRSTCVRKAAILRYHLGDNPVMASPVDSDLVDAIVALDPQPRDQTWSSLSLIILDAVWSIGSKYNAVVVPNVEAVAEHFGVAPYVKHGERLEADPLPLRQLEALGPTALTELTNKQKTSTRSGIPKAEAAGVPCSWAGCRCLAGRPACGRPISPRLRMCDYPSPRRRESWHVIYLPALAATSLPGRARCLPKIPWAWFQRIRSGESVEIHQIDGFHTRLGP